MANMQEQEVRGWCSSQIPPSAESIYAILCDAKGRFREDEGLYWDFKESWPFSLSDEYFGGLARNICAFSNTNGGMLVFGVHDKHRTGGHNKVTVNFDKFRQALKQLLGTEISLSVKSYTDSVNGDVVVIFIAERPIGVRPHKFNKAVGKYPAHKIWIRSAHEVIEATPAHFPMLFCRSQVESHDELPVVLDGSLPPSPATLKRFIGRMKVMEDLFDWLQNSDEPRVYLYGKGGSGKTTIAFEFAQLLKLYGSGMKINGANKIDGIVFLSAKELSLRTFSIPALAGVEPDFHDEAELYAKLLLYGRWILDEEKLNAMDVVILRGEIKSLFDFSSIVIFIDDIDTLTTKGVDPGSDYIYRTLCRAARISKIVYTLRNAPSQSMGNSIEVPGLYGPDYNEFVRECAQEFKVKEPTAEFRDGQLASMSERRPLVIESIIALVRTAASYKRAGELFEQHTGDQIRDYVFLREWDALSPVSAARSLLAALSDLNEPTSFSQLETLLQISSSRLQDAVGEIREMFLKIDQVGDEALFSLAPLTRRFVSAKKETLKTYSVIKERIKAFKRNVYISNSKVAAEVTRIERIIPPRDAYHPPEDADEAWRAVNRSDLRPEVTEDPLFRSLYGYAASCCTPSRLSEARSAFEYSSQMKFEPEFRYLMAWFFAERNTGVFDEWCEKIADLIISGKRYSESEKLNMISRKAISMYTRGRYRLTTDYIDGIKCIRESLSLHLRAFRLNCLAGNVYAELSEKYARNTMFTLFNSLPKDEPWERIDVVRSLAETKDVYLDPIEDAVREFVVITIPPIRRLDIANRARRRLKGVPEIIGRSELWLSSGAGHRVVELIRLADKTLGDLTQK